MVQLVGSTYVGGTGNDGLNFKASYTLPDPTTGINYVEMHGNDSLYYNYGDGARGEVVVNSKSYIYVGTNTFSSDFPSGINQGFQPSAGGGQDGVVFALSPDLSQLAWSSYLGGSQDDAIFSISLDNEENVFVTGGTTSTNFPTTANAYNQTHNGGSTDAFIAKIAHNGTFLLTSSFFGSPAYDNAYLSAPTTTTRSISAVRLNAEELYSYKTQGIMCQIAVSSSQSSTTISQQLNGQPNSAQIQANQTSQ